jgi:hypothetical protein
MSAGKRDRGRGDRRRAGGSHPARTAHLAWLRTGVMMVGIAAAPAPAAAQALTGTTGLVSVPTAQMAPDGTLTVGMGLVDRQFNGYTQEVLHEYRSLVHFVRIGFLPFAEVGLRLSRLKDYDEPQALGDRMVSVRLRVLPERAATPAVVVGAHDIVGTRLFHALYVVGSKEMDSIPGVGSVSAHLGYGGHLQGVTARNYQFQGVFGGIAVAPRRWVVLMAEHDAEAMNAGVRLLPGRGVALLAAVHADGAYSGGISYTHRLNR